MLKALLETCIVYLVNLNMMTPYYLMKGFYSNFLNEIKIIMLFF